MRAESEVKGTDASKTSEDVLGKGLFGMFGCDCVHFPSNFYSCFVLNGLMALLVLDGFVFFWFFSVIQSKKAFCFLSEVIPAWFDFPWRAAQLNNLMVSNLKQTH